MNPMESNFIKKASNMDTHLQLEQYLCPELRKIVGKIPETFKTTMEEIRLRMNQPLMVYGNNQDYFVSPTGELVKDRERGFPVGRINIENTLQFISNYSIYAVEEELKRGYITITGGHRVGIVGRVVTDDKGIKTMRDFSGLNIRVSREKKGVANSVMKYLINERGDFYNTLIVSPPQCGKTTLLRDIIRHISNGMPALGLRGLKIGVVDERSEIGGSFQGVPQNDLGVRTDLLDGCPKAAGMMMLIRAMSPEVIATDEVGKQEDNMAIEEALMAGIRLITTVHGNSVEDLYHKKIICNLVKDKIFQRIIVLSNKGDVGTIEGIYDGNTMKNLIMSPIRNRVVRSNDH
ncbi:stage III sporulation protein AA [Alkaliphilus hydrothermalis]|uniref:Stage III sporulation protein AA n=1 Tax=Alkaliphilus hydrothermalis TaxID=1482730 RepID=A0ABS2NM19_9FIRM|nr:stage III sporulation protein AA [Alkaliphilus hydrothermalis]MBM7613995.1 stage III sporulation protein AA [Alkaliphilus hydrothermalis]